SENNTGSNPTSANGNNTIQSALPVEAGSTSAAGGAWTIIYNSLGNWAPKFADNKLLLAFDTVLGNTAGANGTNSGVNGKNNTTWWGASAYAKYQLNDWFSLASRGEYLGGDNIAKVNTTPSNTQGGLSWWEYTITAGFNVIDNVLIRAEYRLDWGTNISGSFNQTQNSAGPTHYAGAEVVYSF
ncbi:MAG: hypothetical protein EBY81_05280, partial [Verrucomicrobia bacterium]|nr:hypothetical protein [Verrucomicrobiota bacterium]